MKKHPFKKIAAVQPSAKTPMVYTKNFSILNFKQLKPFTMKVKSTFTIMAFTIAVSGSLQIANAQNTSPFWSLAGNSNTTATSKLGTTNAKPLKLVTNNQTRAVIDATNGNIAIGVSSNFADPRYRLYVAGDSSSQGSIWGDGSAYGVVGTGTYGLWGSGSYGAYGNGLTYGVWGNSDGG